MGQLLMTTTRAPLAPPPHICGPLHRPDAIAARARWINAQPSSWNAVQLSKALGIRPEAVREAAPGHFAQVPHSLASATRAPVSLPETPFALDADHEETAPRRGVMSQPGKQGMAAVIDAFRAEHRRPRPAEGRGMTRKRTTPLTAPPHLRGRMSRWTPQALRDERIAWAAAAGWAGHTSPQVGKALGIAQRNAHRLMVAGGWDAWADKRAAARRGEA